MMRQYPRTTTFIISKELWAFAKYRTELLGLSSVSEYLFELIKKDKEKDLFQKK